MNTPDKILQLPGVKNSIMSFRKHSTAAFLFPSIK